ncbi:hypothetical protein GOA55_18985 [Sinorhizobium meliloti]|nr:hypothetical protein [Sinorhizobium meliloti]
MTERKRFLAGLAAGILIIAACIEAVRAGAERGWLGTFDSFLWWIGRFKWLYDYQTLITGCAAVLAATWSVRAVRDQIKSSDAAVQKQIDYAARIEKDRIEAKRDAARVTLPLALSGICDYAESSGRHFEALRKKSIAGRLPRGHALPEFPALPDNAISAIKETVEFVDIQDRRVFAHLVRRIQVQSARIRGLADETRMSRGIARANIESYLVDCILIYAQASDLFDFARAETENVPLELSNDALSSAFAVLGIYDDDVRARLREQALRAYRNTA